MKLEELLDVMFDETWVRITKPNGEQEEVWIADYLGGYEATIETLTPILSCEIVDEVDMVIDTNPETKKGKVPILCVKLIGEPELARIPKEDIFNAVGKDNNFCANQKVTDFYWSEDELVFCTNKKNHETEHYTIEEFARQMGNYFDGVYDANEIDVSGDVFIFKKRIP